MPITEENLKKYITENDQELDGIVRSVFDKMTRDPSKEPDLSNIRTAVNGTWRLTMLQKLEPNEEARTKNNIRPLCMKVEQATGVPDKIKTKVAAEAQRRAEKTPTQPAQPAPASAAPSTPPPQPSPDNQNIPIPPESISKGKEHLSTLQALPPTERLSLYLMDHTNEILKEIADEACKSGVTQWGDDQSQAVKDRLRDGIRRSDLNLSPEVFSDADLDILLNGTSFKLTLEPKGQELFTNIKKEKNIHEVKSFINFDANIDSAIESYYSHVPSKPTKWEEPNTQAVKALLRARADIKFNTPGNASLDQAFNELSENLTEKIATKGQALIAAQAQQKPAAVIPPAQPGPAQEPPPSQPAPAQEPTPAEKAKIYIDANIDAAVEKYFNAVKPNKWDKAQTGAVRQALINGVRTSIPQEALNNAALTKLLDGVADAIQTKGEALITKSKAPAAKPPAPPSAPSQPAGTPEARMKEIMTNHLHIMGSEFDDMIDRVVENIPASANLSADALLNQRTEQAYLGWISSLFFTDERNQLHSAGVAEADYQKYLRDIIRNKLKAKAAPGAQPAAAPGTQPAAAPAAPSSAAPAQPAETDAEMAARLQAEEQAAFAAQQRPAPSPVGAPVPPPVVPVVPVVPPAAGEDDDPDLAAGIAASLAEPNPASGQPFALAGAEDDLTRALRISKEEADAASAKAQSNTAASTPSDPSTTSRPTTSPPTVPAQSTPPQPSSGSSSSSSSDVAPRDAIAHYITDMGEESKLSQGTFYGRSNRLEKKKVADRALVILDDVNKSSLQKYLDLQIAIKDNRKYTGMPLFHLDHEGSLESLLIKASNKILEALKADQSKPCQAPMAKLEAYIAAAKEMEKEQNLNAGTKLGSFVIKSDQIGKLALANSVKTLVSTLNNAPSKEQLEATSTELNNKINENIKLTGDNFLHKKGKLNDILVELKTEVDAKLETLKKASPAAGNS